VSLLRSARRHIHHHQPRCFGIEAFTPIINYPETAVLGLGAIRREPVVLDDGSIASREQMTLSLTFDHRVVDGAPAARSCKPCVKESKTLRRGWLNEVLKTKS